MQAEISARVYIITDRREAGRCGRDLVDAVAAAVAAVRPGGALVQLREKDMEGRALVELARRLVEVARPRRCPVLVNDRVDVALAAGADGVHLPEAGFDVAIARRLAGARPFVVGASTHSAEAAVAAARAGADVVVCGPVWETPSKRPFGQPLGVGAIAAAAAAMRDEQLRARLFAVGGVTGPARARDACAAGAWGVAAIRAVLAAGDPGAAAGALAAACEPVG